MNHLYEDTNGVIHLCEVKEIHTGTFLVWTKCGEDVPANESFKSSEKPSCLECLGRDE